MGRAIIPAAVAVVEGYDTPVTLRQLFYRLVSAQLLENTQNAYKALSSRTAEQRRQGAFPDLSDRTRSIHVPYYYVDPTDAPGRDCARLPPGPDRRAGRHPLHRCGEERARGAAPCLVW